MSLQKWSCSKCNTFSSFGSVEGLRNQLKRKNGAAYASSELRKRSRDAMTKIVSAEVSAEKHLIKEGKHRVSYKIWDEENKKYKQKWVKESNNAKSKTENIFSRMFKRPTPTKT
jgi:tRNA A22 N-methylase|tara:strand:+ start:1454 stop:1795 length:342 start_codon:yes stop_codon:yes gene_type:complete